MVRSVITLGLFAIGAASGQAANSSTNEVLPASTTIPIIFTRGIDANRAHAGDAIAARTTQLVKLADGRVIQAGSAVMGHVVTGTPFVFDRTPYARQKQASLEIHFDSIMDHGRQIPLSVYVRALADPLSSWSAVEAGSTDMDSLRTTTQVGGDLVVPSQSEVRSPNDEVVGYQKRGGIYAHLIAASGNSPEGCDGSETEQSMGIFSASACGLYGFADTTLAQSGRIGASGTLVLQSRRQAPKIYANSTALLEVTSANSQVAAR